MNYISMRSPMLLMDPMDEMGGFPDVQTRYMVPYERNDEYLKLINQEDPRKPETLLQTESGFLLYADIDFEYNYYAPAFESFTRYAFASHNTSYTATNGQVRQIPNLNLFLLSGTAMVENNTNFYDVYQANTSLYNINQVPPTHINWHAHGIHEVMPEEYMKQDLLSLEYFEKVESSYNHLYMWNNVTTIHPSQHASIFMDKYEFLKDLPGYSKPEFINMEVAQHYADLQNKREMFPFFAKFKLCGVQKNTFCDLLENVDLVEEFIDYLVMHRDEGKMLDIDYTYNLYNKDTGIYEQDDFISRIHVYSAEGFKAHLSHGINNTLTWSSNQTTCSFFESFINSQLFGSTLDQWLSSATPEESMPVAFRLEKYDATTGTTALHELISTHYFYNYTDLLEFKYHDSVVAFDGRFKYNLRVINLYVHQRASGTKTLLFIEEPYYQETIHILDSPPVAPDVELLTYRGVSDRNLILINQMIDKEALVPIEINPSDRESFDRQYDAQDIERPNPIIFESDSPTDFEIFKLMEKPTSYADFVKGEYKHLYTDGANSIGYEDKIVPNKYYYYIFRAQDAHGYVSNPSPVYEFVLIKEGETMYPKIRIVDFKKPEPPTQKSKSFKRYLKIGFSPRQYTSPYTTDMENPNHPSYDPSFDPNLTEPVIGISDDNIIGSDRVFKFRIRSKNTGKLIDINVTFKKNNLIRE